MALDPTPGRVFLVGPSHSFEQFASAIDAAFARWDLSHLHTFELSDGRRIGYPDDEFAPELVWLDHTKLKVTKEVKPGEEFTYVFDLGDHRLHPAFAELTAVLVVVIAAVGEQPLGALAGTPRPAGYRPDGIEQRQQLCDVVAVPAGQADRQRDSVGVGDQMVL